MFSSPTVASLIISRLDTQDSFRLRNIGLILEADLDFLTFDFVVMQLAFFVPFLDLGDVSALDVLLGSDVPELIFLFTVHGDVAGDRAVPVALRVSKLQRGVLPVADVNILLVHAWTKFVGGFPGGAVNLTDVDLLFGGVILW